jgi:ATP-dependent Clp protease ATP-binding subunit ClpA
MEAPVEVRSTELQLGDDMSQVLAGAKGLASAEQKTSVEPDHILLSMAHLQVEALEKIKVSPDTIRQAYDFIPFEGATNGHTPELSEDTEGLLERAKAHAKMYGMDEVDIHDVLGALITTKPVFGKDPEPLYKTPFELLTGPTSVHSVNNAIRQEKVKKVDETLEDQLRSLQSKLGDPASRAAILEAVISANSQIAGQEVRDERQK